MNGNGIPVIGLGTWSLLRNNGRPDNSVIVADNAVDAVDMALAAIEDRLRSSG